MGEGAEYRPGFRGVAGYVTAISQPDPDGGELRYRGVPVGQLVSRVSFDGVWRWLVYGDVSEQVLGIPPSGLPGSGEVPPGEVITSLQRALVELAAREPEASDVSLDLERATSVLAHTVGAAWARREGRRPAGVDGDCGVVARLLQARGDAGPRDEEALASLLGLMAEHGSSASTLVCRIVASTGARAPLALTAGVAAMSGAKHGGAAVQVAEILQRIHEGASSERVVADLAAQGRRFPGFGHRIYRETDPREVLLRDLCERLDAPWYDAARSYVAAVTQHLLRQGKASTLPRNPDMWIPVVVHSLGVPADLTTAVLLVGRTAGWSAHIVEQRAQGDLLRPADIYRGPSPRNWPGRGHPDLKGPRV